MSLKVFKTRDEAEVEAAKRQKEAMEYSSPKTYGVVQAAAETYHVKRKMGFPGISDEYLMEDGSFKIVKKEQIPTSSSPTIGRQTMATGKETTKALKDFETLLELICKKDYPEAHQLLKQIKLSLVKKYYNENFSADSNEMETFNSVSNLREFLKKEDENKK